MEPQPPQRIQEGRVRVGFQKGTLIWFSNLLLHRLYPSHTASPVFPRALAFGGDSKGRTQEGTSRISVAHACNPSYSGGRNQEDQGLKSTPANSSQDPISKKPNHRKRAGGVAQGEGPEFKPKYRGKKKKEAVSFP
jgi:hypothetical protein